MSDKVIGKCPKCGMSFTAGHSCGFENPFKGVVSVDEFVKKMLTTRNMALEEMAKVAVEKWGIDNCKLVEEMSGESITWRFEPTQQPQPAPKLVEVLTDYFDWIDTGCAYSTDYKLQGHYNDKMRLALAAEKRRQELVTTLINYAKDYRGGLPTLVAQALRNLDAFDKERGV